MGDACGGKLRSRLIALLGMGGMGKTALSVKLAEQLQGEFEYVIWRSLRHAPFLHDKLTECIKILSCQQVITLPANPHEQIGCLIEYFRKSRCLLILDNFDTLLQHGKQTGYYREGYESYGELLWRLGETQHQSCVLLTSREKPAEIATLEGDGLPVRTLALSGLEVAAAETILSLKGLLSTDNETHQLIDCYRGNPLALKGQRLVSASFDQTVKLWNVDTGVWECFMTLLGHTGVITSVAFSPQGDRIASGSYDQTVKIWDTDTGKCLDTLNKHRNRIWSVAFHPQGHLIASGGDDHAARVWELKSGKCTKTLQGHSNIIYAIAHSWQQNLLASGHEDQTIKLWDVNLNAPQNLKVDLQPFRVLHGHSNRVFGVAFSTDGQFLASASADRTIKLWSPHTGQCLKTLYGHSSWVWAIAFSPDSNFLASGSYDHTIKIWDVSSGKCLQTLLGHPGCVLAIAFSPDGKTLFSSGYEKIVKRWDVETGKCLHTWEADSNRIWAIAVSPDHQYVATGGDDSSVQLWDIHTGACLRIFHGHTSQIVCILFTADHSRMISSSSDVYDGLRLRTVKIWHLATGDCITTLKNHQNWVWSLSLSPDEQTLLSGSQDETINCWDIATGKRWTTLRPSRSYEGTIITEVKGLTEAEMSTLQALGAVEVNSDCSMLVNFR